MGNINISKYRFPKKIMRLCAIGMVANDKVDETEKKCIANIIVRDIINNCKGIKGTQQEFEKFTDGLSPEYDSSHCAHCEETNTEASSYSYSYSGKDIEFSICIDIKSDEYKWVTKKYLQKKYGNKNISEEEIVKIVNNDRGVVEFINNCYVWARYYIEYSIKRLGEFNERQGLFVDIIPYKEKDVRQELFDIILVILADNLVVESERVAFMAIARIFRVRKVALIWDKLANLNSRNQLFNGKFKIRIQRKDIIDADDVLMIQDAICNYKIKGALKEGLKNATIAEKERYVNTIDQNNKFLFKWALWGFAISAIVLYFSISFLIEDKVVIRECLDDESPIENIYYTTAIGELREDLYINKRDSSHIKKKQDSLKSIFSNADVIIKLASLNVRDYAELDKDAIKKAKKDITKWKLKDNSFNGDSKFINEWMHFFIIWLGWVLVSRGWKRLKNIPYIYLFWDRVLLGVTIAVFALLLLLYLYTSEITLSILHNPIWVLILMICIELMIFLRQVNVEKLEDEKKKNSTGLLVVIVVMAIVSDMCISFIELPVDWDGRMLADKFAAALLLGCLCFFIGRFLNMYSLQQRVNISNMTESIKNIVTESESSQKN